MSHARARIDARPVAVVLGALAAGGLLLVLGALHATTPAEFLILCGAFGLLAGVAISARTSPAWLISLGVVVAPMAGNWERVGFPGTLAPDRILLLAGVIATLARVPAVVDLPSPRLRTSHWLFLGYFAYALVSAVAVGTIFTETVFQVERLGVTAFGVFLAAPVAFARAEDRRILLLCLCALGTYLGLLAIVEVAAPALAFPQFVADPSVARHLGRARGPFLEAEMNGFALFTSLAAALVLRATSQVRAERLLALAVVGLCGLGILLTLTRINWLGTLLGFAAVLIFTADLRRYLVPTLAAGVLLVLGAFAVIPGFAASATDRAGNQTTVWDRQNLNRAALNMVWEKPLTGHGWNTFKAVANDYFWQADDYPLGPIKAKSGAHNVPLGIASELGLIGVTLWAAAFAVAFWEGLTGPIPPELRPWRIALIALIVQYLIHLLAAPVDHPYLQLVMLLWAGIAAGPSSRQDRVAELG